MQLESNSERQKYVLVKGSSGLGNRMLAALTAFLYARICDRKIIVDWSDGSYSQQGKNAFPAYFDCAAAEKLACLPQTESVYPELWKGNLNVSFGSLRAKIRGKGYEDMSVDISRADYEADILVFCAYTQKIRFLRPLFVDNFSSFSARNDRDILRSLLRQELVLKDAIRDRVDRFRQKYFNDRTLGVHIRYSDMKVPLEKIYQKVRSQNRKNTLIFLATDSQEVVRDFRDRFEKNVVTTDKWFPPPGERMHQNTRSDRLHNGIEALTDLYLLASCQSLIFSSQSTFGYVASLLSDADPRKLFDIQQPSLAVRVYRKFARSLGR